MKKMTVEMYKTDDGRIRFVKSVEGGWITFVDADAISVETGSFFSGVRKETLSDMPGLNQTINKALVELAEFIKEQK
jgi:hypothetical protein